MLHIEHLKFNESWKIAAVQFQVSEAVGIQHEVHTKCNQGHKDGNDNGVDQTVFYDLRCCQNGPQKGISTILTIHLRCLFCFNEKRGARICLDGLSQTAGDMSVGMTPRIEQHTQNCRMESIKVGNEDPRSEHEQ